MDFFDPEPVHRDLLMQKLPFAENRNGCRAVSGPDRHAFAFKTLMAGGGIKRWSDLK